MANFLRFKQIFFKNYSLCIFIIFLYISYVESIFFRGKVTVKKIKDTYSKSISSKFNSIDDFYPKNHLKEIRDASSAYVITSAEAHGELKDTIVNFYATKIPIILFQDTTVLSVCDDIRCFKINHIIGIYSQSNDVNVNGWKEMFHDQWNPRAKIIIWLINHTSSDNVEDLLKLFWKYNCMNVVVVVNNKSARFKIYSYNPFIINTFGERGMLYPLSYKAQFFPNKMRNLYGYKIRISLYHRPPYATLKDNKELINGTEVEVVKSMSSKFNFTPVLITSDEDGNDYVVKLQNGIAEGPIGDLLVNKSEMLGNAFYVNSVIGKKVEYITPFFFADYVAIVPKRDEVTIFGQFYHHLVNPFYLMMVISLTILAMYLYIRKERHPILATWQLLLFQNFRTFTSSYWDKYFRITWIVWATIISSLYQGVLYTYLSTPNAESDIDTLEELSDSQLKLQIGAFMITPLNSSEMEHKTKLGQRATLLLKLHDCYEEFQENYDVSCGADKFIGTYYFRKLLISENPTAHIVAEPLGKFWVTYVVKEGFPFLKQLYFTVNQFIENGFFAKWGEDSWRAYKLMPTKKGHQIEPLKMSYFKLAFLALLFGCTIATSILIVENTYTRIKRKRKI